MNRRSIQCAGLACLLALTAASGTALAKTVVYKSQGYTLTVTDDNSGMPQSTIDAMVNVFFNVYPREAADFNPNTSKSVRFIYDPSYNGVAATARATTRISPAWMKAHPQDTDVVTHEVMHIVQDYGAQDIPGWLVEGIADYARYRYGVNNAAAGWRLPNYQPGQYYTDSYRVTARFLAWVEARHPGAVEGLDAAMRQRRYSGNTWVQVTGATVDQNWARYTSNPRL